MKKVIGIAMVISALTVNSMTALAAVEPGWSCPAGICTEFSQCTGHGACMGDDTCIYQECPNHGACAAAGNGYHEEHGCASTSGRGGHHRSGRHAGGHHR